MRFKLLAASLLVGSFPFAATAVPITGEFTATVWGVTESGAAVPGGIDAGTTVTGAFQFENQGQAAYQELGGGIDESRYLSYSPGSFLRISIGSSVWESAGLSIGVRNDSDNLGDDMLALLFSTNLGFFDPAFPGATSFPGIPAGMANSSFGISLFDTGSLNFLSSQALPGSVSEINLDSANYRNGSIFGNANGADAYYAINFNIDSVMMRDVATSVPEPGTLPLVAAGLLAVWLFARRRGVARELRARLSPIAKIRASGKND